MIHQIVAGLARPWRFAAVLLVAFALLLTQVRPVEAAIGAGGEFRLLLANGPAFVSAEFHRVFAGGLAPNTIVLLVRAPRA